MATRTEVHNGMDIIDSRDVMARIDELEGFRDDAVITDEDSADVEKFTALNGTDYKLTDDWDESADEELKALSALAEEGENSGDWKHGESLINDSYFQEYAEQLAEDIGAIDRNAKWPLNHIDWEAAADELKSDYTSVDFDGVTYWIRS